MSDTTTRSPLEVLLDDLDAALVAIDPEVARTLAPVLRVLCFGMPALEARLDLLELAVRGIAYEPAEEVREAELEEVTTTVFGIPVRLREGWTAEDVREFVERLRPGLTGDEVVHALVDGGLVYRKIREV